MKTKSITIFKLNAWVLFFMLFLFASFFFLQPLNILDIVITSKRVMNHLLKNSEVLKIVNGINGGHFSFLIQMAGTFFLSLISLLDT